MIGHDAYDFLALLDTDAGEYTFQIMKDVEGRELSYRAMRGSLEVGPTCRTLEAANELSGAGIGVVVNDGAIRAVWHDGGDTSFPLAPSYVAQVSPDRYHSYWVIDQGEDEMTDTTFLEIMAVMVNRYGSDPDTMFPDQAMRLPGTKNHRPEARGFEVKYHNGELERYPAETIASHFLPSDPEQTGQGDERKFDAATSQLADETIADVKARFDSFKEHQPSPEHWRGLWEIAATYHGMATGTLEPKTYLSALPCGMGKTTVIIEATKVLLQSDSKAGVIVFLSRVEEIKALTKRMGLSEDDFAVIVSKASEEQILKKDEKDGKDGSLGNPVPTRARVLFTTQQMLERRSKDETPFANIEEFYYRGQPRQVRIWDETIDPSSVITIERDDISGLLKGLKLAGLSNLKEEIDDWNYKLKSAKDKEIVFVPPIDITMESFRSLFPYDEQKDKAEALWRISGHHVRVRKDKNGTTMLDYVDILPEDLAPLLVLDASGGLRKTYSFWEEHRGGLEILYSPEKTYNNLTIHFWDRAAGKTTQSKYKERKDIAEGVAKAINTEIPAGEEILVIYHKQKKASDDLTKMVSDAINDPKAKEKVRFLNWGRHTATNAYHNVKYVIMAGILQYNTAQIEAYGRAAKDADTEDEFDEADFAKIREGEISHNILQGSCRGSVRKSVDGDCPKGCHLYVVCSTNKGTGFPKDRLKAIFNETNLQDWQPMPEPLSKRDQEAFDYIVSALMHSESVKSPAVAEAIKMHKKDFRKRVKAGTPLRLALEAEGILSNDATGKNGASFYRKALVAA